MRKLFIVELYCGTKSVSKALANLYKDKFQVRTLSVDNDAIWKPDVCGNILKWNYKKDIPKFLSGKKSGDVVIVHASPPCKHYSLANTLGDRNLALGDSLVKQALRIITFVKPNYWTLENPRALLRGRPFMKQYLPYLKTGSYCKYGFPYRKNTDIFTNIDCKLKTCAEAPCKAVREFGVHTHTAQKGPSENKKGGARGFSRKGALFPLPVGFVRDIFAPALGKPRNVREKNSGKNRSAKISLSSRGGRR